MLILDAPGFAAGFVQAPLASAHLLSLIGLGLLAGCTVARTSIMTLAAFALGLSAGLGAIASGVGETPANDVLFAAAGVCGAIAALGWAVPTWLAVPAALFIGCAVGLDSPPDAISLREAVMTLIGTGC